MKIITFLFSALLFFSVSVAQNKSGENQKNRRIEKIINSQWTFNYFPTASADQGYESPGFDDSKWPAVSIPHTWNTYETTGELHPFIRSASENDNPYWWMGWGWYRKHFSVKSEYSDRKVFIEFEAVQKYCKVWLNGKYLGDHKGGYGSFDFDITSLVKPGEDNVLAVAVNNRQKDQFKIPPNSAADFDVYGGIYRDVTIVFKDKLFIPMQGSAIHEGGTFVTTPVVSEKEGVVRVRTWVRNDNLQKKSCTLVTSITDAAEKVVQVMKAEADINPGQIYMFDQIGKPIKNPHLWSNEDPYLYKVYSRVIDGKTETDLYTSPLGFRWFRWDYNENFLYVNGKKMVIHGGNHNQDYPWLGDAIPKWITLMDIKDLAGNLNYNFIRTSHFPGDRFIYDMTDNFGIVTAEEYTGTVNQALSADVQESLIKEMIRRDRNHPSIMFWRMGNNTSHMTDSKIALSEDTTRILSAEVAGVADRALIKHTGKNFAIEDPLRCAIRGWYNKDVKDLEPAEFNQCGTEEHQQNMLKASGKFGTGNICTWLYEDHGADSEYLNSPLLHVDPEGYVDAYRIPKYAYYFWQANYSKEPMVFILPHFWRAQYLGQSKDIAVNSNCDKIELMVNGISKGSQSPEQKDFHSVTFKNILIEKGTLSAVGTKDGKIVKMQLEMPDEPARILLTGSQTKINADKGTVVIITADITDKKGNHIYGAVNTLKWTLSGPATLVGPGVYESDINKHQEMEGAWYMDTPVSNVIRSSGKPGKIHVSVSASGLTSGAFDIDAEITENTNSPVTEPVLRDDGRNAVARIILKARRLEEIPREIKLTNDELNLGRSDKHGYLRTIKDYIIKNNSSLDTTTTEFNTLTDLFATQLVNSNGHLVADDYNFSVDHYNNCRLISGYINSTRLPPLFKDGLKKFYSDVIIMKGSEKNAGEEMNWLNWIPSGGTVVIVTDDMTNTGQKGALFTKNSGLEAIICVVYPQFAYFSAESKERAMGFISKANPYIHITSEPGNANKLVYTAEKGQPILIPLLKFISE
jgi:hypothetical protein